MTNADSNTCSLLSGSGGLHCNSMRAFIALRLSAARVSDDMENLNAGGSIAPSPPTPSSASNGIGLLTNDETPVARTVGETQDGLASTITSALMSAQVMPDSHVSGGR
jgi:hypothetical protein